MSTITITPQPVEAPDSEVPADFPWPLHRMSLEQYDALVESGIFTERDRLQLINGILVAKVTQGDDHRVADEDCRTALQRVLPPGWFIRSNKPVDFPPNGAPEPDQAVVRGSNRDYGRAKRGRPGAKDVALIVEIAQSSLTEDRAMVTIYGPGGIPVYWIINLVDRQVEVYSGPGPDGYASRIDYRSGQEIPVVIDGVVVGQIAVDDLLPG
jgi:Uma2 family endonuclease